jgi:hypothetical protein
MMMQRLARLSAATAAFWLAATCAAGAQTWSWTYANSGEYSSHGLSSATLDLERSEIKTSNRVALDGRPDVVYTCTVRLDDVSRAIAVHAGSNSLLIALKPDRSANCAVIGHPQSLVLRADDGALIDRVAAAINGACCTVAAAPPPTAPPPTARPEPFRRAEPARRPEPVAAKPTAAPRVAEAATARPKPAQRSVALTENSAPRLVRAGLSEPVPGKTGVIAIRVAVGANGSPQDASIVSSTNDDLDDAGIEIAASSTYAPAVRAGRPVPSDFILTISFSAGTPSVSASTSAR